MRRRRRTPAVSGAISGSGTSAADTLPVWLRLIFLLVAVETLRVAVGLFAPSLVNGFLPWPASPLNARFIAALYGSVGAALLIAQAARSYREVRILLAGILTASSLILLVTVLRLLRYPAEVRPFPGLWLAFYILDPLLTAAALLRLGWQAGGRGDGTAYGAAWTVAALAFGLVGLAAMLAPDFARSLWPWTMTQPQSQLYGAFFLAFAVASALAARETDWQAVRLLAVLMVVLAGLIVVSSLLHLGRFTQRASAAIWFAFFCIQLFAAALVLAREELRSVPNGSVRRRLVR